MGRVFLTIQPMVGVKDYFAFADAQKQAPALIAMEKADKPMSFIQKETLELYRDELLNTQPDPEKVAKRIEQMRGSYATAAASVHRRVWNAETQYFARQGLWDRLGMMLLRHGAVQIRRAHAGLEQSRVLDDADRGYGSGRASTRGRPNVLARFRAGRGDGADGAETIRHARSCRAGDADRHSGMFRTVLERLPQRPVGAGSRRRA